MQTETIVPEKIRVVATEKKFERAPIYLAPKIGPGKQLISGLEKIDLSKEEKKELEANFVLSDEEEVPVRHLEILDLSVPHDKAKYFFLKTQVDYIAGSKNSVKNGKHRFYLENKSEEAKIKVNMRQVRKKASDLAYEIIEGGEEKIKDALRLFSIGFRSFEKDSSQLQEALLNKAETSPEHFIKMLGDMFKEQRVFMAKLVDAGIISRTKTKSYIHEGNVIALKDENMIEFLNDKNNSGLVSLWAKEIGVDKGVKVNETSSAQYSTDLEIKDAKKRILGFKDAALLQDFIFGEERTQVLDVATQRIQSLNS